MAYQTILVYLSDKKSAERVLNTAISLAVRHDAHLIGLHVASVFHVYSTVAVDLTAEILDAQKKALEVEAAGIKKIFDKMTKKEAIECEWRSLQVNSTMVSAVVINHARCTDLVVAAQSDHDYDDNNAIRILEQLLIDTGRPVLMVPYAGEHTDFGHNITIAWNASRESARAVASAMPMLKRAEKVTVLWVNPQSETGEVMNVPGSEIATCLSRHGINVETDFSRTKLPEVGDEILSRLADNQSDMLVMGAYGHSRLREFIFGGASRHLLEHMTVPVLMTH